MNRQGESDGINSASPCALWEAASTLVANVDAAMFVLSFFHVPEAHANVAWTSSKDWSRAGHGRDARVPPSARIRTVFLSPSNSGWLVQSLELFIILRQQGRQAASQ
jgi:hypothetical protein